MLLLPLWLFLERMFFSASTALYQVASWAIFDPGLFSIWSARVLFREQRELVPSSHALSKHLYVANELEITWLFLNDPLELNSPDV